MRLSDVSFDVPDPNTTSDNASRYMVASARYNRGYVLQSAAGTRQTGYTHLAGVDLSTGEVVNSTQLTPQGLRQRTGSKPHWAVGHLQTIVMDDAGERVFVPFERRSPGTAVNSGADTVAPDCAATVWGATVGTCLGGVHFIHAETLEPLGRFSLEEVRIEAALLSPVLRALSYEPPVQRGGTLVPEKLYLVVEDAVHHTGTGASPGVDPRIDSPRYQQPLTYLLQVDIASGRQDWILRLEACRGVREQSGTSDGGQANMPAPSIVFRDRRDGGTVYAACHNRGQAALIVKVPLNVDGFPAAAPVESDPSRLQEDPSTSVRTADTATSFQGPEKTLQYRADPQSGRILLQVVDGRPVAEVWWVFDTRGWQIIGTIGIGPYGNTDKTMAGIDSVRGRLYVMGVRKPDFAGGLFIADIRRTPLPQALQFPGVADALGDSGGSEKLALTVVPSLEEGGPTRVFVRELDFPSSAPVINRYRMIIDALPLSVDQGAFNYDNRTLDLDEVLGVTEATFDGAARGFGTRFLAVGGVDAMSRVGPADPVGAAVGINEFFLEPNQEGAVLYGLKEQNIHVNRLSPVQFPLVSPCTAGNREIVLGLVGVGGPSVVDAAGSRASAEPIVMDSALRTDLDNPLSRCAPVDWAELWNAGLFARPVAEEPTLEWAFQPGETQCVSSSETSEDRFSDPVTSNMAAAVSCDDESVSGYGYFRGAPLGPVTVAETTSSFRVYRDPGRGIVSRVESVARGIDVEGVLRVATVRAVAESWANGRQFMEPELEEGEIYDPNCDFERTAGTCFQRQIFGVWTPGYSCGPCGDEQRLIDGMNRGAGAYMKIEFREPDAALARGADNGFIAAIQKPDGERFSDLVLNSDLMQTVVPALEVVRYASPSRPVVGGGTRGRQIYQFAGVEVSSSYGIQCLLVYDEDSNTCGAPAEPPGAITVSLQDTEGEPLAGGAFEVRQDVDADGVLGLVDTLLPDGACVTAEDGVGTCSFEDLHPGAYLISQVSAPPGYAKSDEPFVVELASGEQRTVAFTNVSNVSTIELTAQDENGGPLSGATFAAYADPDSDGKVAPDAQPAATCTTGADGACTMQVPAGSYVLVQTAAPGGLEGIEPVPFTFASGGQVAAVTITNYPPEAAGVAAPPPAPSPVYTPPVDIAPPVESIDDGYVPPAAQPEVAPGDGGVIGQVGGTVVQVIRAPGDALRLLSRDPKQAVAWTAALALFVLAVMAIRRRQQAMALLRLE